ncbi:TetR/AcrR family transcriptional regulator [Pontibacter litorisediminis]|uniref:TetR/AcrR family transcriptional regulator n=1 Tax=Pontibacter litorisediminis TaxID=1846260 RepID=UPI0023EE0E64|nr:TetR/AcrR family transcriptional regulator [Pontibacter litorisediminis]
MEPIADKKKAIFKSMLALVKENGFHGAPMSLVAKRAGVAAGTIYHYFESKEELIQALFQHIREEVIAVVIREDSENEPFKKCFFKIWYGLYFYYTENADALKFLEQYVNSPYHTERDELGEDKFFRYLFRFFERGTRGGHLKPISPKILGILAHSNVISTVKVLASGRLKLEEGELKQIPQVLWDGMRSN